MVRNKNKDASSVDRNLNSNERILVSIDNFKNYFENLKSKRANGSTIEKTDIAQLETRLSNFDLMYKELLETIAVEHEYIDLENDYFQTVAETKVFLTEVEKIENRSFSNNPNPSGMASSVPYGVQGQADFVKLPTIEVPKFNGDVRDWLQFRDLFNTLIHNNRQLTSVQKYYYLRMALTGNANQAVKSLEISSQNYEVAYNTLCERYNNSRLLINSHVKSLFTLEKIHNENPFKIRKLIDEFSKHLYALKQLEQPVESWDTLVIYIISQKLDEKTLVEWEKFKNDEVPNLEQFKKFLNTRANVLDSVQIAQKRETSRIVKSFINASEDKCLICETDRHSITMCPKFKSLSVNERTDEIKNLKLCLNCFKPFHFTYRCRKPPCNLCKRKHHNMLHLHFKKSNDNSVAEPEVESPSLEEVEPSTSRASLSLACQSISHTLLSTAVIKIQAENGKICEARAILDAGSNVSIVSESLCQKLGVKTKRTNLAITGINQQVTSINQMCNLKVISKFNEFSANFEAVVLHKLNHTIPSNKINKNKMRIPADIYLADPRFYEPGEINILLGVDLFYEVLLPKQIKLGTNMPILQETHLGYVISGKIPDAVYNNLVRCNLGQIRERDDLKEELERFWKIESIDCNDGMKLTPEELLCENHFKEHMRRKQDGRFEVKLPIIDDINKLGNSRKISEKRLLTLEKKLDKDVELKQEYAKYINEYIELGHMQLAKDKINDKEKEYFVPHFPIFKDSLTTQLRIVFDMSVPTSSGFSLNNLQLNGRILQRDLLSILIEFRTFKFVVSADITKMYRQVLINEEDRKFQKILWRNNTNEPIREYEMLRLVFGTKSAPFLAVRCLYELAKQAHNSEVSSILKNNCYVDDFLFGAESEEKAIELTKGLKDVLNSGCFPLRKFRSNSAYVLEQLNHNTRNDDEFKVLNISSEHKMLGLVWNSKADILTFKANSTETVPTTKRQMLSSISKLFDPLGLIAPSIILAKIIIQQLWLLQVAWDEQLPDDVVFQYGRIVEELHFLNKLKILRSVETDKDCEVELHAFSDASQKCYGACVYVRVIKNEKITVALLTAKAKVAPLKQLTVPKLELCGGVIANQLINKILEAVNIKINRCIIWTDSSILLGWLKNPSYKLLPFVSSRIVELQNNLNIAEWRHVGTRNNPADILSRGVLPSKLINDELWWTGPTWLKLPEENWPVSNIDKVILPEVKKKFEVFSTITQSPIINFEHFSNINRLIRAVGYVKRFINNLKAKKEKRLTDALSLKELRDAHDLIIQLIQRDAFLIEINMLENDSLISLKSKLLQLDPFLDDNKMLRVGGRLKNSKYKYSKKHPLLLPSSHHVTELIIKNIHHLTLHAGPNLTLAAFRERYWVTRGRNMCKKVIHRCIICFKARPRELYQAKMGNLPAERISISLPFRTSSVDYGGPVNIKLGPGRIKKTIKAYICLFICQATKAVHLELITDLTGDNFLAAFKRFISRRGIPHKILSDNGTNFIKAARDLKDLAIFLELNQNEIIEQLKLKSIEWQFIPPNSPHFGGLHEAGIKACKFHLKRIVGNALLTYEQFNTILIQIEAIMNSRPLSPLSSDPNDYSPLTPSHFLLGRNCMEHLGADNLEDVPSNRLDQYERMEQLRQHFWRRWASEYVSDLQRRSKWPTTTGQLKVGDLVLLKDSNTPPMQWRMGRILKLRPGNDGIVRVVEVKTRNGTFVRATPRICLLPVNT